MISQIIHGRDNTLQMITQSGGQILQIQNADNSKTPCEIVLQQPEMGKAHKRY